MSHIIELYISSHCLSKLQFSYIN